VAGEGRARERELGNAAGVHVAADSRPVAGVVVVLRPRGEAVRRVREPRLEDHQREHVVGQRAGPRRSRGDKEAGEGKDKAGGGHRDAASGARTEEGAQITAAPCPFARSSFGGVPERGGGSAAQARRGGAWRSWEHSEATPLRCY
jgi:hypothetical protein